MGKTNKTLRTYKEALKENPALYVCFDNCYCVDDLDELLFSYLDYVDEDDLINIKCPDVYVATQVHLKININHILDNIEESLYEDAHEDWQFHCNDELKEKLQAVLDEIVTYASDYDSTYNIGEQIDITTEWEAAKTEFYKDLQKDNI